MAPTATGNGGFASFLRSNFSTSFSLQKRSNSVQVSSAVCVTGAAWLLERYMHTFSNAKYKQAKRKGRREVGEERGGLGGGVGGPTDHFRTETYDSPTQTCHFRTKTHTFRTQTSHDKFMYNASRISFNMAPKTTWVEAFFQFCSRRLETKFPNTYVSNMPPNHLDRGLLSVWLATT